MVRVLVLLLLWSSIRFQYSLLLAWPSSWPQYQPIEFASRTLTRSKRAGDQYEPVLELRSLPPVRTDKPVHPPIQPRGFSESRADRTKR
jgi:hypothetical protein